MRVLLDESMPRRFGRLLPGHAVSTVQREGWASIGNGELPRLAEAAGFDALVTVDRSLEHQQNVAGSGLGVVVLVVRSNRLVDVGPLAPRVMAALGTLQPGAVVRVEAKS